MQGGRVLERLQSGHGGSKAPTATLTQIKEDWPYSWPHATCQQRF